MKYKKYKIYVGLEIGKFSYCVNIIGYYDVDFAKNLKFRWSTTSYILTMCGYYLSWKSRLQFDRTLLATDIEYITLTKCIKEASWIQSLLSEIISWKKRYNIHRQGAYYISEKNQLIMIELNKLVLNTISFDLVF